jgi:phosphoribosyl 1,2-cyclic phosphate phosphodiesterase
MLKRPIDIYASSEVQESVRSEFFYAFVRDKYPGVPQIVLHTIENEPFAVDNIPIIPISVLHFKMHVYGFRFGDFTYITDASYISYEEKQKIFGSKIIVINALRKQLHYSHFNLEQAVALLTELKPNAGYITHMSHLMGKHAVVENELPDFIRFAYDGLKLEL